MAKGKKVNNQAAKVKEICEMYATQSITIESACKACGISVRTFNGWCNKNAEYADLYKRACDEQFEKYKMEVIEKAKTSLIKMIEGYEVEEITQEGVFESRGEQKVWMPTKIRRRKRFVEPNVGAIIFALTNFDSKRFINPKYGNPLVIEERREISIIEEKVKDMSIEEMFFVLHGRHPEPGELRLE